MARDGGTSGDGRDGADGEHQGSKMVEKLKRTSRSTRFPSSFRVTGLAAHQRIAPLLKSMSDFDWVDVTYGGEGEGEEEGDEGAGNGESRRSQREGDGSARGAAPPRKVEVEVVDFLWENAPRHETKSYRDKVFAYSHLPNGRQILDCKWSLARLLPVPPPEEEPNPPKGGGEEEDRCAGGDEEVSPPFVGALETHCFRGRSGLRSLLAEGTLWKKKKGGDTSSGNGGNGEAIGRNHLPPEEGGEGNAASREEGDDRSPQLPFDLLPSAATTAQHHGGIGTDDPNLWVIKDASSNGAGGIWVCDESRARDLAYGRLGGESGGGEGEAEYEVADNDEPQHSQQRQQQASTLHEGHRYVAQRYAWPMVLYGGRKCHVRVYGLVTSDGRAFVHRRAFLHVANEPFPVAAAGSSSASSAHAGNDCVHITNCCANSHDGDKFAGEICADLEEEEEKVSAKATNSATTAAGDVEASSGRLRTVGLGRFAPSVYATVAALAERSFPYLQGGRGNGGFEYLGMDFILSYGGRSDSPAIDGSGRRSPMVPKAYLLEVNCPPSQDTATGLKHAEETHDSVLRDLLTLWVVPRVFAESGVEEKPGGWRCVYRVPDAVATTKTRSSVPPVLPSQAAVINKMRWALFERKASRRSRGSVASNSSGTATKRRSLTAEETLKAVRSCFPFFRKKRQLVFLENAGGSQVPQLVLDYVDAGLRHRHRSLNGTLWREHARRTMHAILGADPDSHRLYLGSNATSLLALLAAEYVRIGLLRASDEVVISTENHLANVTPWVDAAKAAGAEVVWWDNDCIDSLGALLNDRTRIVAITHASNILGRVRDVASICRKVREATATSGCRRAHVVVDGVATASHVYANVDNLGADWYAVSCHKLFGPHMGVISGRKSILADTTVLTCNDNDGNSGNASPKFRLELGTVNYEACAGVVGLGQYFARLALLSGNGHEKEDCGVAGEWDRFATTRTGADQLLLSSKADQELSGSSKDSFILLNKDIVDSAYRIIRDTELGIFKLLHSALTKSKKVCIVEGQQSYDLKDRLPLVSLVHSDIPSHDIAGACLRAGVACRSGTFLSCSKFQRQHNIDPVDGVIRFSAVHYNSPADVKRLVQVLESIPGWF